MRVWVWGLATGRLLHTLTGHTHGVAAVAAANARIISGSDDGTVRVWQLVTGRLLHTLTGHTGKVAAVAVADGQIISGSWDDTVRVWQLATGQELVSWEADAAIQACDASMDDTDGHRLIVAAGDNGGAVHILELRS